MLFDFNFLIYFFFLVSFKFFGYFLTLPNYSKQSYNFRIKLYLSYINIDFRCSKLSKKVYFNRLYFVISVTYS